MSLLLIGGYSNFYEADFVERQVWCDICSFNIRRIFYVLIYLSLTLPPMFAVVVRNCGFMIDVIVPGTMKHSWCHNTDTWQ